jgi:hypothetical protein
MSSTFVFCQLVLEANGKRQVAASVKAQEKRREVPKLLNMRVNVTRKGGGR